MNVKESYEIARRILKKSGGDKDPDVIAKCLGVEIFEFDLHNLKGMYSSADRHRTIFLSTRLMGYMRNFVLLHEIAHDQIPEHRERAKNKPYKELKFFGGVDMSEREANSIVAHILIDDNDMVYWLQEGYTISQVAAELNVPEDILLIELEDYNKLHPGRIECKFRFN